MTVQTQTRGIFIFGIIPSIISAIRQRFGKVSQIPPELDAKLRNLRVDVGLLENQKRELENTVNSLKTQLMNLLKEESQLTVKLSELKSKDDAFKEANSNLYNRLAALQQAENLLRIRYNNIVGGKISEYGFAPYPGANCYVLTFKPQPI